MRRGVYLFCLLILAGTDAWAMPACRNRDALGTSRVIVANPVEFSRIGMLQYSSYPQLPLKEKEVVITFDDGPLPATTSAILDTLAAECVRATFFMIGRQATAFPEMARRVRAEGHTVGTHSQNHPLTFDQMPIERVRAEIEDGIKSVSDALGDKNALAPYFRIPGLLRVAPVEDYLTARNIAIWSADFDAEDWYRNVTPQDIVRKAITRLEAKQRGVLLLHDVQPATALALPELLRELKTRGYKVVAVVPRPDRPERLERPERQERYERQRPAPQARERSRMRVERSWPQVIYSNNPPPPPWLR